jgi:hypothetical protein
MLQRQLGLFRRSAPKPGLPTLIIAIAVICTISVESSADNPLASWNDGPTKKSIVDFVTRVTDKNGNDYIKPADRIATFDNDGCCWNEKPLYIHLFANLDRFKELMKADAKVAEKQPFKAIASKDLSYFMDLLEKGETDTIVGDVFGVPFEGMTTDEFARWNHDWLATWKHPRFKVGYRNLTYQPMVELIHYLRDNDFDVHIFTADEGAFLKLVATELYEIPSRNVHGSSVKLKYEVDEEKVKLVRTAESKYLDNWDGKPRLIFQSIGKRPIFAAGNSNGDLHMLQYVSQQDGPSISVLVHHTDAEREYAYDKHTDKVMPLAKKEGWTVVDMKQDWRTIFSK